MLMGVTEGRLGQVGGGEPGSLSKTGLGLRGEGVFHGRELHNKEGKDFFLTLGSEYSVDLELRSPPRGGLAPPAQKGPG